MDNRSCTWTTGAAHGQQEPHMDNRNRTRTTGAALGRPRSTRQGPELPLDVYTLGLCNTGFIPQRPKMHLDVAGQQEHMLLLDVSTVHHTALTCNLTCQHYR
jgi:hypothetical protein